MSTLKIVPEVIEDRPVAGFAANVEDGRDLPDTDLSLRLRDVARDLEAGRPGDQNIASDLLHKIISRVRGRKLVEDHGLHEVEIPWLCLHVPAGGKARLQVADAERGTSGVKLSLMGLGLGSGWSFGANLKRDFQERTSCLALVETFQVHVRSYAFQGTPDDVEYRSDVVEHVGTSAYELGRCPLCYPTPEDPPVLANKAGPAIDLSADPVGQKVSEQLVLSGSSELEIGLKTKLPGDLALSAGVTCKRKVSFTCTLDYAFAGGRRYQPMRRLQYVDLPFWRIG